MPKPEKNPQAAPAAAVEAAPPAAVGNGSLLEKIRGEVAAMNPEQVAEQVAKIKAQREKFRSYVNTKELTPEEKEKRKAKMKEYTSRPEVKAKMKAYMQREDVKARNKEQYKARREREKAVIARAKELGITL